MRCAACASPSTSPTPASPRAAPPTELVRAGRVQRRRRARARSGARDRGGERVELDGRRSRAARSASSTRSTSRAGRRLDRRATPTAARPCVALVDDPRRLYPVGRLDADSTGLILLTNDGELANLLTHPAPRGARRPTARASAAAARTPPRSTRLRAGVELDDGPTRPGARAPASGRTRSSSSCARAASARCGACARRSATRCSRSSASRFGPLELGDLAPGAHRRARATPRSRGFATRRDGRLRRVTPRSPARRARRDERRATTRAEAILAAHRGADARADRAQRARDRPVRQLHLHGDERPRRRVPGARRAAHRLRAGAAAVHARDRRARLARAASSACSRTTTRRADHVARHVYLGEARSLRADLDAAQ